MSIYPCKGIRRVSKLLVVLQAVGQALAVALGILFIVIQASITSPLPLPAWDVFL